MHSQNAPLDGLVDAQCVAVNAADPIRQATQLCRRISADIAIASWQSGFAAASSGRADKLVLCRATSVSTLMYVKEDLIIPHHISFYDLISTKARGKSGPLFDFDVHEDIRVQNDARIEKDESHAGVRVRSASSINLPPALSA